MKKRQLWDRVPWNIWGVVLPNWSTLLCFEVLYRVVGFELLFPLLRLLLSLLPGLVGVPYLGQKNILSILRHPGALLVISLAVWIAILYTAIEITALFVYGEKGWRREPLTMWALLKETALRMWDLLHPKRLGVLLLLPPMSLSIFALTSGYLHSVKIPEFILDFIQGQPAFSLLFFTAMLLVHLILFTYLYGFPSLLLGRESFPGSWRESLKLLQREKRRTAWEIAAGLLLLASTAALVILAAVVLTVLRVRWFCPPEQMQEQFQYFMLSAGKLWTAFSGAFLSAYLCAATVILYHERRGEERPRPKRPEHAWKTILFRAVVTLGTVLLAIFFSETEMGGWRGYSPQLTTKVVAHRAGASFAPENTVAALGKAAEDGAHMAEIDVQQLKDGTLVVLHDINFLRTTGVDFPVWEATYGDVEGMDAGSSFDAAFAGEPIPTLEQMLQSAKGRIQLMIELKSTGHETDLVEQTVTLIRQAGMEQQCVIASMDMDLLERAKALDPEIKTVYISVLLLTNQYDLKDIDAYSVEITSLTPELVYQAHLQGKEVYAWTANTEGSINTVLYNRADGVVTDNPSLAWYCIQESGRNQLLDELTRFFFPVQ